MMYDCQHHPILDSANIMILHHDDSSLKLFTINISSIRFLIAAPPHTNVDAIFVASTSTTIGTSIY